MKEDVDKTRELGLPASVILIDSPWTSAYNDYKFNPKQFDDAPAMVKHLHEEGYKLVLWHTSWINSKSDRRRRPGSPTRCAPRSENYQFAADQGLFVKNPNGSPYVGHWWKGQGSMIDFTYPKAKEWWQDQVRQAIKAGADGFKDDDAEGAFLGSDVKFADGTDPRVMRNRYAVLYNNAMEELIQKDLKGNGVLFARSVTVGANGIGFLWGGDNEASFSPQNGLPTVVTAGLSAGMSGMPLWAADLGGYLGVRRHSKRAAAGAVDGIRRLLSDDGGDVDEEYLAVELRSQRTDGQPRSARYLPQVCSAAHEPLSLSLRRRTGGREDRHADHARAGAELSGRRARPHHQG